MPIKTVQKLTQTFVAIAVLGSAIACQPDPETGATRSPETVTVRSAYVELEGLFVQEVFNIGLERLGYQTADLKQLDPTLIHVAIGDGELDFFSGHWETLYEEFFQRSGGEEQLERVGVVVPEVLQGYQIDKKTAEEYNITNLEQLRDPEIAALFDSDGDGLANLTGCNPGWGCELVIEHHLDRYELRDTVEHDRGSYSALLADTITRYRRGESVLYYTWTPHWLETVMKPGEDAIWLEVPFTSLPESQGDVAEEETSIDGKNLGFAVDRMRVVANQNFIDNNPTAERFFESVEIPIEDINAQNQLIQQGEDTPEDIRRHAEEWIAENRELFDSWIERSRDEN